MRRPPKTYSLTDGFPIGVLPAQLREVVLSVHEDTQAPVSLIFASVLSAMSLGCQDLVDITRPDGKRHPINLYLLTLADSGELHHRIGRDTCEEYELDWLRSQFVALR